MNIRTPRSPRLTKLLDSLETIYANPNGSETVRFEAARLAAKILARKTKPTTKKTSVLEKEVSRLRKLETRSVATAAVARETVSWPATIADEEGK